MQKMKDFLPNISGGDKLALCDGYLENGKPVWFDSPKTLQEISCQYCDGAEMYSCKMNDGSEKSELRVAFCYKYNCPRPRPERQNQAINKLIDWSRMGIPYDYLGKTLDNFLFSNPEGKKKAESFVVSITNNTWFFSGDVRQGKTHLAIALGKAFVERLGLDMLFVTHSQMYFELLEAMKTNNQRAVIEKYVRVTLLIIDDMAVLRGTPMENDLTYEIISQRLNRKCKTIITTNRSDAELEAQYGPRLMSRLGEKAEIKRFRSKRTESPKVEFLSKTVSM